MKSKSTTLRRVAFGGLIAATLATPGARAQEDVSLEPGRNRFMLGGRFLFDVKAEFVNKSQPLNAASGGLYDDGFVLPDASGNAFNSTWNWGYNGNSQYSGNKVTQHRATSPRDGLTEELTHDPGYGGFIAYGRDLWRWSGHKNRPISLGLQGAFGSTWLWMNKATTVTGTAMRLDHTFTDLSGLPQPASPYQGTFDGPGRRLDLTATSAGPTAVAASSAQRNQLDTLLLGFSAGPYVEIPLPARLSLWLGGGVAVVHADMEHTFSETLTVAGVGAPVARSGAASETEWLFGAYGEARLNFMLSEETAVFVGGQYQILDDSGVSSPTRSATLKQKATLSGTVGLLFSF